MNTIKDTHSSTGPTSPTNAPRVRRSIPVFASMTAVVVGLMGCQSLMAQIRPNIVLILTDDLGYNDVGFNGSKDILTPNLDRLAEGGTVFTSAYVAHPFCGPSRMGLMTGRYPHSFGAPFNLPPVGLGIEEYNRKGIDVNEILISNVLQEAGYYTGAVGKWHLGIESEFHPNKRGFDDFYGFLGGGHMYFPERYGLIYERQKKNGKTLFNEYIVPLEHNGHEVTETEYMTDALSREGVRFVKEASVKKKPFFLYLAYNAPHTPLEAKDEDMAKFASIEDDKRRTYAGMVYAVDRGVGRLVEALKSAGAYEETLIIFLSDNGGKIGGGSDNSPLSMGKGSICEGGFRVPMFFHWPGRVRAGEQYHHPVTALDFYPTFARLAGAKIPAGKRLDGKDVWDAIQAGDSVRKDEMIFVLRHWNGFHNVGIRMNQWKASKRGPNSPWNLFDLDEDIGEANDVSDRHPEIVKQMIDAGREWSQSHTTPEWFDNLKGAQRWHDNGMPVYTSTFATDGGSPSKPTSANPTATSTALKARASLAVKRPSDISLPEWIAREKVKWEGKGWRWNQEIVETAFREMDTNRDGLASGKERQVWFARKKAEQSR